MAASEVTSDFLDAVVERLAEKLLPAVVERLDKQIKPSDRESCSISKAARRLGVSEDILYIMCREGSIPHFRVGASTSKKPAIRFSMNVLDEWIVEQERKNYKAT